MHSLGPRNLPRIYTLAMLAGAVTSGIHVRRAQADEYFDPQALEITADQQQASDLSYFSRQGGQQPGRYRVAVVVNQTQRDEREIAFVDTGGTLSPVLNLAYLKRLGVNIAAFSSFDALQYALSTKKISLRRTRRSPFRPAIIRRMTFTVSVKQMMTAIQTSTCITGVTAHSSV